MNILITGGSNGLGKSMVEFYAKNANNKVYFTYCNSIENANSIETQHPNTQKLHCDFTNSKSVKDLCEFIANTLLDSIINNAFVGYEVKHFHKFKSTSYGESFLKNVAPTIQILNASVAIFRKRKAGKIINILSSVTNKEAVMGYSVYAAEKKYIEAISNSIAIENTKFNIQCNCISPSFLETDFNNKIDERIVYQMRLNSPQKRFLTNEEVVKTVDNLVNNDSIYFNGQNIILNAGL